MATYDYLKSKNGHKIQVESAKRDGAGKNIENTYAKQNGYYSQLTAGLADNLTPYSEDSGVHQENPFISNGTGTNNNQEIVTVGDYALVQEKQGNSVVVNEVLVDGNFSSTARWGGTNGNVSASGNVLTYTVTTVQPDNRNRISQGDASFVKDHKYWITVTVKSSAQNGFCNLATYSNTLVGSVFGGSFGSLTSSFQTFFKVVTATQTASDVNVRLGLFDNGGTGLVGDTYNVKDFYIVDITTWGADVIADITANPSHFFWYYNGSLAYNTGSLESANGVKLVSTGRNLCDEDFEVGGINMNGQEETAPNRIRTKHFIPIVGGKNCYLYSLNNAEVHRYFYDKDKNFISGIFNSTSGIFNVPQNASFIRLVVFGTTTYNHDITISLYYTPEQGGEGYDKYYPYEEPTIVDTGSEVLRSAGSVRDYKEPSGVIHRVVGSFNGTQMTFVKLTEQGLNLYRIQTTGTNLAKQGSENIESSFGIPNVPLFTSSTETNEVIQRASNSGEFYVLLKTDRTLEDFVLYYELAQETTEQGTPYPETLPINDYGMLYWLDENDNLVGIPQGAKIFFPVNYKGFVDDVYSRTDGDAGKLVLQEEITEFVKQVDLSDQITAAEGLTLTIAHKKAYKTGNTFTITLVIANNGSDIPANSNIVNLGSIPVIPSYGISGSALLVNDASTPITARITSGGYVRLGTAFISTNLVYISFSYALA